MFTIRQKEKKKKILLLSDEDIKLGFWAIEMLEEEHNKKENMKKEFKTSEEMVAEWEKGAELDSHVQIVLNAIKTPDGTVLMSHHRHDYVTYTDKTNGLEYMVDGGHEYLRRNVHEGDPYEEVSVTDSAPFEQIRESLHWGNRGKDNRQPLMYVPISKMADDHIQAILDLKMGAEWVQSTMREELSYRKENNISVAETER